MAKVHELIFKIKGNLDSKITSSFARATGNIDGMARSLNKLEQKNLNFKKYDQLTKSIESTSKSLNKAKEASEPLKKSFEDSQKATNQLHKEWQKAERRVDDLAMAVAKSTKPTAEMRSELAVAKLEAKDLNRQFKDSERATKALGNEFKSADRETGNLERSLESQKRQLDETGNALDMAGRSTEDFRRAQKRTEDSIRQTTRVLEAQKKVQENWSNVKSTASSFAKTGAAYTAAAAIPLKVSIDRESVMADVAKKVDFDSIAERMAFEQEMQKRISTDLPLRFQEYGDLIAGAAGAGIQKSELMSFGADAAKMAVAFDIEGGEAGSTMAKWRAAFQLDQQGVMALADKVNYLGDNSAALAPEITNIVSKVGALGGVAGLGSGQVAAIGTAMVSMGVDADIGATAIKKMTTSLTKGADAPKAAEAYFKKMGMTSAQVSQDMQKDAEGTVLKVLRGIRDLEEAEQVSALRNIFGEVSIGAVAPLLSNIEELEKYFSMVDESSGKYMGSMQKEFETRSATTANSLTLLQNNFAGIVDTVGKSLLPILAELSGHVLEAAQKFQQWANENPQTLNAIVRITAVLGALIVAGKGIMVVVSILKLLGSVGVMSFLKIGWVAGKVFRALKFGGGLVVSIFKGALIPAVKLVGAAFMGLPVVGQIALIVAAIALLYKNWDKITKFFQDTIKKIGDWIGGLVGGFKTFGDTVSSIWGKVKNFFTGANDGLDQVNSRTDNRQRSVVTSTGEVVNAYARGGIVTKPELAMIGEGGDHEAVIPLNNTQRAASLWKYAGNRLGLLNDTPRLKPIVGSNNSGSKNEFHLHFNVEVNGGGDKEDVKEYLLSALREATPEMVRAIKQILDEIEWNDKRVSFS